jgi:hypothetical protein
LYKLKSRKVILGIFLACLLAATAFSIYGMAPLTYGSGSVASASVFAKQNEVISFGFSVKNKGIAVVRVEKLDMSVSAGQVEIIEIVFVKSDRLETVGVINGTAQENGFDTFPTDGYVIEA